MNKRQYIFILIVLFIPALIGGAFSNRIFMPMPAMAQRDSEIAKVIYAEKFHLLDKNGGIRASLVMSDYGTPSLSFWNKDGKSLIALSIHPDGTPSLAFFNKDGKVLLELITDTDDNAALVIRDKGEKRRTHLSMGPNGLPHLALISEDPEGSVNVKYFSHKFGKDISH